MSATLFLLVINPFLLHFEEALVGKYEGIVRACADDIGVCLKDYRSLKALHRVFSFAKQIANLTLKPSKCNTIPLNLIEPSIGDGSLEVQIISLWIAKAIPDWKDFKIKFAAKYLGFFSGLNLLKPFGMPL